MAVLTAIKPCLWGEASRRIHSKGASNAYWWLSTPNSDNTNNAWNVNSDGTINNNNVNNVYGLAPD